MSSRPVFRCWPAWTTVMILLIGAVGCGTLVNRAGPKGTPVPPMAMDDSDDELLAEELGVDVDEVRRMMERRDAVRPILPELQAQGLIESVEMGSVDEFPKVVFVGEVPDSARKLFEGIDVELVGGGKIPDSVLDELPLTIEASLANLGYRSFAQKSEGTTVVVYVECCLDMDKAEATHLVTPELEAELESDSPASLSRYGGTMRTLIDDHLRFEFVDNADDQVPVAEPLNEDDG